jgi:hypothetical protein
MRWRVSVFFAAGLIAAATASPIRAQDGSTPHQAEYLKIYLKINDADQLERKGDFRGALADFKDCYARLQRIHNDDPSWESALVIHRMDDCRAKILYLEEQVSQMPPGPADTSTPETSTGGSSGTVSPAPTVGSDEGEKLRAQLSQVQQELEDTKAKLGNEQLENNSLRTQLDAVNSELSALKTGQNADERMGKLLDENKKLSDKLSAAEKEVATLRPVHPKSALGKISAELKNTQDKPARPGAGRPARRQPAPDRCRAEQRRLRQAQARKRNHARHPDAGVARTGPSRHGQAAHAGGIRPPEDHLHRPARTARYRQLAHDASHFRSGARSSREPQDHPGPGRRR